jgi:hypothetical protein
MNRHIAKVFIGLCGFCVPLIMAGQSWASVPFLLAVIGILYYSYNNKLLENNQ